LLFNKDDDDDTGDEFRAGRTTTPRFECDYEENAQQLQREQEQQERRIEMLRKSGSRENDDEEGRRPEKPGAFAHLDPVGGRANGFEIGV
jgi:hypothetical protein